MNSDVWRTKRIKRLEIDKYECRCCGFKENLEVHHKPDSYKKIPNESIDDDLTTLCVFCHDLITNRIRENRYAKTEILTKPYTNILKETNYDCSNQLEKIECAAHRPLPTFSP